MIGPEHRIFNSHQSAAVRGHDDAMEFGTGANEGYNFHPPSLRNIKVPRGEREIFYCLSFFATTLLLSPPGIDLVAAPPLQSRADRNRNSK